MAKKILKKKKKPLSVKKNTSKKLKKIAPKKKVVKRKKKVLAIPKGYHSITPYLTVNNGADAIEFYKKAFAAKTKGSIQTPDGKIAHAELQIGDSKIMLGDRCPEMGASNPERFGGNPVGIHLYVKDVDATVKRAVAAGAKLMRPVEDMFYGDRSGELQDPFGHQWHVATHMEDLTLAKIKKRATEIFGKK